MYGCYNPQHSITTDQDHSCIPEFFRERHGFPPQQMAQQARKHKKVWNVTRICLMLLKGSINRKADWFNSCYCFKVGICFPDCQVSFLRFCCWGIFGINGVVCPTRLSSNIYHETLGRVLWYPIPCTLSPLWV